MTDIYPESNAFHKGLYDMKAEVLIYPIGMVDNLEHVELRIAGEVIGEYPTYTQACYEVIRIVNQ